MLDWNGRLRVGLTWDDQRFTNIKIQNCIRNKKWRLRMSQLRDSDEEGDFF